MTINQMTYIITIAKCMNFSEAARLLYITQPALSRQVSLVEEELGTKIFIRNNKSVSLTKAGEVLCLGIDEILRKYNSLIDEVRNLGLTFSKKLRVGLISLRPPLPIVTKAVNRLIQRGYEVDVLSKSRTELQESLINGDVDIIITHDGTLVPESSKYNSITLATVNNCLVIPASHYLASQNVTSLSSFKDCEFLMIDEENKVYEKQFQFSCKKAGFTPKIKYLDSLASLVAMISVGAGITCFPFDHYLRTLPNLKFLLLPEIVGTDIMAIWHCNSNNQCLKYFIRFLCDSFGQNT